MATFEIPAEPDTDRVWLLDHPEHGGPLQADRFENGRWSLATPGGYAYWSWSELLALGTVTDVDPDDMSWLPPGPWTVDGGEVIDAEGRHLLHVTSDFSFEKATPVAELVARLVNEHVARHAGGA